MVFTRGYLPHFDQGCSVQSVTLHLFDSLPKDALIRMERALAIIPPEKQDLAQRRRIEELIDAGAGSCLLAQSEVAALVEKTLLYFDGKRFNLNAWSIMPNHLHFLATLLPNESLSKIMQSFKSYTAHEANKLLGRSGPFWFRDYYDRFMRDYKHYQAILQYIEYNPVKAGLCVEPRQWQFGSARRRSDKS